MGCGYTKKCREAKISSQIMNKVIHNLNRTKSNTSANDSLSRKNSVQTPECLKIKIYTEDSKISLSNLNLSGTPAYMSGFEYAPDYNFLKSRYLLYQSSYSYFCSQVHETCFSEFKVHYGLFILLISLYSNPSVHITLTPEIPFIDIKGELHPDTHSLYKAWTDFLKELEKVSKNNSHKCRKSMKRIEVFVSGLKESLEISNRPTKIKKAIKMCENVLEASTELVSNTEKGLIDITLFFRKIILNKTELNIFVNKAKELKIYSGERIVHTLFNVE